ncbi:uncharacterized protein [Diadema setosum]|uniref:uncharacterized protein n=1 Tax=Diadema setosum TaxID=31175 RepID=UPI003B3B21E9
MDTFESEQKYLVVDPGPDGKRVQLTEDRLHVGNFGCACASVVNTDPNVQGWKGEGIRLRCDIQEEPLAVIWVMEDSSPDQQRTTKARFFDGKFQSREERFDIDKNFSLVISDLEVADESRYYCQVVLKSLDNFENFTIMTISSSVVNTASNVQGWRGEDIQLRCDIHEELLAVFWVKASVLHPELRTTKAEYFDGNFESLEERFDIDKNFSLVISDLEVADEGLYYCQVLLKNTKIFENSTSMTISSMASRNIIEECVDKTQSRQSRCTYQSPSNTPSLNLTCVVSGFKPNVSMIWTKESGKRLNSVVSQQNTLSDGTYERFETITVSAIHGTEQTFICAATGDSLNGTSTREITVLPVSGKRENFAFIIGLAIGLSVVLIVVFFLVGKYLQNKHPDFLPRKGCGWNPCWRRPNISERFHDEEELMLRTSSLTNEQVLRCKEELKAYYRMSRRKVTVDPLNFMERVELDEIYTNLSIIDRTSKDITKTPITYCDLLTNDENGHISKRLLIQGEGGVGKTTLCAKIAWDWCQGRILQDLDMVILIPLRDVTNEKSIGGIVKDYLSDSNTAKTNQIDQYISTNQGRVLIIFDGFDEFNGKLSERNSSEVIRIMGIEQYKTCKVFVTTRPWRTDEFMMDRILADAYTFLSIEGFNEENVSAYIMRYFQIREKDNLGESLISFMEENDIIRSNMAPFPIYCAMLCLMWNDCSMENREKMQNLQTFANIFREMISFLKEHYASKAGANLQKRNAVEHLKKACEAIQEIGEIALNGLLDRNLSFPEEQFRDCHDAMETCCRVGVLTIEKDVITRERRRDVNIQSFLESTVSFPHKLFQEYIAGVYVGNVFANDRAKYNKVKNKLLSRHKEFRYLFYFISALGNELGLDIIHGLMKLMDIHREYCVDVAFECHTEEAARAVGERWEEYEFSSYLPEHEHTNSGVVFMLHFNQVRSLLIYDVKCGRTMSRDLAEGMCSSCLLRKVQLTNSRFHTDFYKILGAEASKCQIQDLDLYFSNSHGDFQHYQSSMGGDLARWVFSMPRLSNFRLGCPYFPDYFLSTAVASAAFCQIQDLGLNFGNPHDDSQYQYSVGEDLVKWLFTMPCLSSFSLRCLYLPERFLSTAAASASSCQIHDLDLDFGNSPDDSRYQSSMGGDFVLWVFTMPCLSRLRLRCPYLPDNFLSMSAASASSSQIQDLEFHFDNQNDDSRYQSSVGGDLAQWVFTMPRLRKFTLSCQYLSDSFLSTAIASASSCQIQEISLHAAVMYSSFIVSDSAAAKLAQFLCRLPHLTLADVNCDNLPGTFFMTIASQAQRCKVRINKLLSSLHHVFKMGRGGAIADLRPRGYTFHHCPRVSKRGGGVGFLYKDNLQVVINPSRKYTTFESMHGTVSYEHSCVDIVVVYRPPGNHSFSTFLDEFSQFLDESMYRPSPLVITGDLNIHFDNTSSPNTLRFNDLISGHGISQLVSSPTHDKGHILDVIMVRNSDNVLYSSPKVFSGISDHSAVSCLLKFVKPSRVMSEFTCRNVKKINRTAFAEDIVSCKLMSSPTDSVDCVVENYNSALSRLLNIHAPVKTRKIRKRTDCPWYNSDIAAAKRKRRRLERKWLSNGKSEIDRKLLCAQKNVVNSLLKKAKRSYYVGLIEDCGEDSKRLFSVANRLLNRKQSSPLPSHTDSSAMAETFIDYFRNKVETISNSLCPDESAQEPLTTASLEILKPTDPDEVQALLRRLPPKSCSLDPVPTVESITINGKPLRGLLSDNHTVMTAAQEKSDEVMDHRASLLGKDT